MSGGPTAVTTSAAGTASAGPIREDSPGTFGEDPAGPQPPHPSRIDANGSRRRSRTSVAFYVCCVIVAMLSVAVLVVLLVSIGVQGWSRLSWDLLSNSHSELEPETAGMWPSIVGSLFILAVCAAVALPLGIGTAIFLEEFQPKNKLLRWLHSFVQINIANLAGVPSIVYGLLGLSLFVYMFNFFGQIQVNQPGGIELMGVSRYYQVLTIAGGGHTVLIPASDHTSPGEEIASTITIDEPIDAVDAGGNPVPLELWKRGTPKPDDPAVRRRTVRAGQSGGLYAKTQWNYFRLPFGRSFLAAGLTLSLVILPVIIIASQEALRSVSPSLREASLGLGSTTWQTVRGVSLPAAMPGIMTGAILAMGRAIGEAAPVLVVLGAAVAKDTGPKNLMDNVVTMPVLIYNWAGRQQATYQELAASAIIVLLVVLLLMNSIAIYLRQRMRLS